MHRRGGSRPARRSDRTAFQRLTDWHRDCTQWTVARSMKRLPPAGGGGFQPGPAPIVVAEEKVYKIYVRRSRSSFLQSGVPAGTPERSGRPRRLRKWAGTGWAAAGCFCFDQPREEDRRVRIRESKPFRTHLPRSQAARAAGPSTISLGAAIHRAAAALWPRLPVAASRLKQLKRCAGRNLKAAFTAGRVTDAASLPFRVV